MNSGLAVVLGAVIALIGGILSPWVTGWITRSADDRRQRRRDRSEVIQEITDAWMVMADFDIRTEADEAEIDAAGSRARRAMARFAIALDKRDAEAVKFVQWATATAIVDAEVGTTIRVAHWAAQQLYEWHWGMRPASSLVRDASKAADYLVGD